MFRGVLESNSTIEFDPKPTIKLIFSIVEILFPKVAREVARKNTSYPMKMKFQKGCPFSIKKRRINIFLPHRIRMVRQP